MLLVLLEILFVIFALLSALFWWLSSRERFSNKAGKTLISVMGKRLFDVADPKELEAFLTKQSRWNSYAALCAALAAIVGVSIGWVAKGDLERSPQTASDCTECATMPEATGRQIK